MRIKDMYFLFVQLLDHVLYIFKIYIVMEHIY